MTRNRLERITLEPGTAPDIHSLPLGNLPLVYAVAPHHPLAAATEPLTDTVIRQHRAVAVADTALQGSALTFGLLGGQDVLTVASMQAIFQAQDYILKANFPQREIPLPARAEEDIF